VLTDTSVKTDTFTMREHVVRLIVDAHRALASDDAIRQRQRSRFADAVARARNGSPFYRELYAGLPTQIDDPTLLHPTDKPTLMARFDEWVTDAAITFDAVRELVDDPARIGESFLGRYTVATTSGTTGKPGVFVMDARSLAVTNAMAVRMLRNWLSMRDVARVIRKRGRMSMVMGTGGHFASAVAASKLLRHRGASRLQVLSVHEPLSRLVEELNRFDPGVVAPYASVAAMLADEQAAGRLHIDPALLTLAAEGLPPDEYGRIVRGTR